MGRGSQVGVGGSQRRGEGADHGGGDSEEEAAAAGIHGRHGFFYLWAWSGNEARGHLNSVAPRQHKVYSACMHT
jgi:hypothetical protein